MQSQVLSAIPVGKTVRLVAIKGERLLSRRLLSLGISLGCEFEIVSLRGKGVVVGRSGNRVALGHGIVEKLFVEVVE